MTNRFAALVPLVFVLALMVAACGATSVPSTASGSAGTSPAAPDAAAAIADTASPEPSSSAVCDLASDRLIATLHATHGMVEATGILPAGQPGSKQTPGDAGELVGARTYAVDFALDLGGTTSPATVESVTATVASNGASVPAQARVHDTTADVTLPDGTGRRTLMLQVSLGMTPCPSVGATIQFGFDLVPAATAAACPSGQDAVIAYVTALDRRLRFGSTALPASEAISITSRFGPEGGSDQVPPFSGFDPHAAPIAVSAGASIPLTSASSAVSLQRADVEVWRRSDVVGPDDNLLPSYGDRIDLQQLAAPKGVATWSAPGAGSYVVGVHPIWTDACVTVEGLDYVNVTVR